LSLLQLASLASLLASNGLPARAATRDKRTLVAVIDDQAVSRALIARLLKDVDEDVDVVQFAEPAKTLEWLANAIPALIVTDYRMPQMDGVEFIRALRASEATRWTPIMLITVLDDKQVKKAALHAGATDFLNKPIDHDECRARCRNLLDLSSYQAFLLEQLAIRNAYIRSLQSTGPSAREHVSEPDMAQNDRFVTLEYQELYEVMSTLAAIDNMLNSWRKKRSTLEAAIKRPLQGDREGK
jgi:CheY-like chemotaxis protein